MSVSDLLYLYMVYDNVYQGNQTINIYVSQIFSVNLWKPVQAEGRILGLKEGMILEWLGDQMWRALVLILK